VAISCRPNLVRLTLNSALATTGAFTVGYTQPAPPRLKSVDAVDVASFTNLAIILPPTLAFVVSDEEAEAEPQAEATPEDKPVPPPPPEPEPQAAPTPEP
jgi:hypothetical protein